MSSFECKKCRKAVNEDRSKFHLHPFVCNSCTVQKKADEMRRLRELPNCERLDKVESWIYDRQEELDYENRIDGDW